VTGRSSDTPARVERIARVLDEAARTRTPVRQLAQQGDELTLAQAYRVQAQLLRLRASRGERLVGLKMGFTSAAKRAQMQIDDLIWGRLTDAMRISCGGTLELGQFIHPRIEPELAFLLEAPLHGAVSAEEARAALGAVAPALEVLDSRYRDFRFSLPDVIADNSSSSAFVIGEWQPLPADLTHLAITLSFDEQVLESDSSAAIMGDPVRSVMAAARLAAESDLTLESGWLVLAGGATAARPLVAGARVSVAVESLGTAALQVRA
jgi:2-oxo-3-hexenedioate decarboxylase